MGEARWSDPPAAVPHPYSGLRCSLQLNTVVSLSVWGRPRPARGYELPPEVSPIDLTVRNVCFVVATNDLTGDRATGDEIVQSCAGLQAAGPEESLLVKADCFPGRPLKTSQAHDAVHCLYRQAIHDRIGRFKGDQS